MSLFALVLLFSLNPSPAPFASAVLVGYYLSYDTCEEAGRKATKQRTIDFICLPVERR